MWCNNMFPNNQIEIIQAMIFRASDQYDILLYAIV